VSRDADREVRLFIYRHFVEEGEPPGADEVADTLDRTVPEVEAAFRRLDVARAIVLLPGTVAIWMAQPLCAVPTSFRVETQTGEWWGTCIWDALGIPAMLDEDGVVSTTCGDCGEPMELSVEDGALVPAEGVAHFAVPAGQWWESIGYT
jgi:hypothetical protein